jgi:SanA protein
MGRVRLAAALAGLLMLVLVALVLLDARGDTASSLEQVPHAEAALVLGAQVLPNGQPSPMLTDRPETKAGLQSDR